jgi:hypothetical protein
MQLCGALLLVAAVADAQVALIKGDRLFVIPRNSTEQVFVCGLWANANSEFGPLDRVSVAWSPKGEIILEHYVDARNGPKRFGLAQNAAAAGIWLVKPRAGARPRKIAIGKGASFSPDGSRMSYLTSKGVAILDMRSRKSFLWAAGCEQPVWSPDARHIAIIHADKDSGGVAELRAFPSGRLVRTLSDAVNLCDMSFSPNSKLMAMQSHLSRPLTGHFLVEVSAKGGLRSLPQRAGFAPANFEDWSPSGRFALCTMRLVDPTNDGSWTRSYVEVADLRTGRSRRLGQGSNARYSPDGRSVWCLTSAHGAGHLASISLATGRKRIIAKDVSQFAVYR